MKQEEFSTGTKLSEITDADEVSRIEELATLSPHCVVITGRRYGGESVDATLYRKPERQKAPFRKLPIDLAMQSNLERSFIYRPIQCDECGTGIESNEYAIWSGGKHYCIPCGTKKYSEPAGEEGLMCTRCGADVDPSDDIWGFDTDSHSEIDMCMCSRCAYITHRFPPWEQLLKEI